jgi:DNA-binding NarL/FixJ family response regulator
LVLHITPYERAVLQLLADGRDHIEIAGRLRISERQLEAGLSRLLTTMGARNTPEAIEAAIRRGLVVRQQEQVFSVPSTA